jgi:hypothetical protein
VSIRPGACEFQIRASGLALQLFGVLTVAVGLNKTRRMFGRPKSVTKARVWLSRFPPWRRDLGISADAGIYGVSGSAITGRLWATGGPGFPIAARVDALEKNVQELNKRLDITENKLDSQAREDADALRREKQARTERDDALQAKLEAAETGGLYISLMGAICLLVGLVLTSVPKEIAQLLR